MYKIFSYHSPFSKMDRKRSGVTYVQNYIYGNFEDSEGDMIDSINPATGQVWKESLGTVFTLVLRVSFPYMRRFGPAFPTAVRRR